MPTGKTAREFAESNLSYVGEARLSKMSAEFLGEILEEYVKIDREQVEEQQRRDLESYDVVNMCKADIVAELLKLKKERAERPSKGSPLIKGGQERGADIPETAPPPPPSPPPESEPAPETVCETPLPDAQKHELPDGERTKLIPCGHDGVALEVTVAGVGESTRIFKDRHELRVCSFNSLKLRTGKAGLEEQWLMLIATLSTFDVVMVQEVPAEGRVKDIETTRAYTLKKAFEHHSGDEWQIVLSEPSGPGPLEVHVALVRSPVELISSCSNKKAGGVALDHCPLTIKVKDGRFRNAGDQTWVFTSVHFPPKSRATERDSQIKAFLREYERESAFRLDTPLTEKGAKDARTSTVHHVVCGDFNCFVGVGYELEKHGFSQPLLGEHVSTSSGGQAYDNFLLSKFCANKFSIDADVLELAMPAISTKGQDGLSDHHPIVCKIRDTACVKSKQKSSMPPVPEQAHGVVV
jgi:endonuclease/exonuclease/phosphatase family metal-dependent hydrolase